jgi:translation initiation factor 3 subunit F
MAAVDLPPATYGCSPALLLNTPSTAIASSNDGAAAVSSSASPDGDSYSNTVSRVDVHPIVLLSVLDHHTRRQEGAGRVIGTLLGKRDGDRVEITNCFAVPHAERGDEVAIGKDFNRQMLALHLRANKRETVVGWYATALPVFDDDDNNNNAAEDSVTYKCIADTSSLIHEFYAGECDDDPIHLVVDTGLTSDAIGLRAYKSTPVVVKGEPLANLFHEIRLSVKSSESERICVDRMIRSSSDPHGGPVSSDTGPDADTGAAALQISMERLLTMLETCSSYVDKVVSGEINFDDADTDRVGRDISDTLNTVPRIRPEVFDKLFNDSLQDLLMVTYLSNITKTQLTIAEKLNETLGK